MLCDLCDKLSISTLLDNLVRRFEEEPSTTWIKQSYWQDHHASIQDLVKSADSGCELCRHIVNCAKLEPPDPINHEGKNSLFDYCYIMEDTKVKISVGMSESATRVEDIKTVDSLLVKFGPFRPDDYGADLEHFKLRCPVSMGLQIVIPQRTEILVEPCNIHVGSFELDLDMASDLNFGIILGWFQECFEHEECLSLKEPVELPTRLVDVGKEPDWEGLRLVEPPKGTKSEYVALSHCWGGPIQPVLTTENYSAFLNHISFSDLPRNFQDALFITRELGGRYIWIDSLCIIQDSPQDWVHEASMMADIYLRAVLTICAGTSEGSTDGIFNQFSSFPPTEDNTASLASAKIQEYTYEMRLYPKSSGDDTTVKLIPGYDCRLYRDLGVKMGERFSDVEELGTLSKRAWCLQEKVLSRRRLVYGRNRIYWQCTADADCTRGLPEGFEPVPPFSNGLLLKYLNSPDPGWRFKSDDEATNIRRKHLLTQGYYEMVRDFSSRELSYEGDMLPAFSGIASTFHPVFGGVYLAGIWSTDITTGLCWYHSDAWEDFRPQEYRAPSWSWMAINSKAHFLAAGEEGTLGRCTCPGAMKLDILSHEIHLANPANPYGLVVGGKLVVEGYTRRLLRMQKQLWTGPEKERVPVSFHTLWDDDVIHVEKLIIHRIDGEEVLVNVFDPEGCLVNGEQWNPDGTGIDEFLVIFADATARDLHKCLNKKIADQAAAGDFAADGASLSSSLETVMSDVWWMWAENQEKDDTMEDELEDPEEQKSGGEGGAETGTSDEQGGAEEHERGKEALMNLGLGDGVEHMFLILKPDADGGPNVYQRVGVLTMVLSLMRPEGSSWGYVRSWERQRLILV
ncbi:hypothetical protein RB598_003036 [Gaeumannomyces tritici]